MVTVDLSKVAVLHTLGPTGTNCEAAAHAWFKRQGCVGSVHLHSTLEQAVENMPEDDTHALLGCVVYPDLHTLVFSNLGRLSLADIFIFPTFNMLLAQRPGVAPLRSVATHPAHDFYNRWPPYVAWWAQPDEVRWDVGCRKLEQLQEHGSTAVAMTLHSPFDVDSNSYRIDHERLSRYKSFYA